MTIAFPRLHILHFDINHNTAAAGWEASNIINNGEGKEQTLLLKDFQDALGSESGASVVIFCLANVLLLYLSP